MKISNILLVGSFVFCVFSTNLNAMDFEGDTSEGEKVKELCQQFEKCVLNKQKNLLDWVGKAQKLPFDYEDLKKPLYTYALCYELMNEICQGKDEKLICVLSNLETFKKFLQEKNLTQILYHTLYYKKGYFDDKGLRDNMVEFLKDLIRNQKEKALQNLINDQILKKFPINIEKFYASTQHIELVTIFSKLAQLAEQNNLREIDNLIREAGAFHQKEQDRINKDNCMTFTILIPVVFIILILL